MTYWEKRQQQLNKQMENDEEKLKKRLSSYYDTEYRKLEKEISSYFHKYGADNILEYRQLMQSLSDDDKKLLIERIDEFIGKYPEYEQLVPVRESIYKLNRLEGLQYSIRMQQYEIGAITNEELKKHLERQAMRGANAAAEAMGFGKNYYVNNTNISKMFVNIPWSNGKNFSQRIWENAEKLSNYLNTDVAQALARGDSYDKIVRNLRKRFIDVSKSDAYRLIYTEGTYVMAESSMYPFTEDFDKYRLSTVGDGKVCSICAGVANEVFDIKDRKPGVNFPPLHPWCRCTFTIEVDDWDKWMDEYEKKHENGNSDIIYDRLNIVKNTGSDMIKEIKIPEEFRQVTGITPDIFENMQKGIDIIENEYELNLKKISVKDLSKTKPDTPYLCRYIDNNGKHEAVFILNSGFDFTGFEDVVSRGYEYNYFAGKDIKDHIIHEMAHVMTGQNIEDAREFEDFLKTIEKEYVPGVSGYSDDAKDGFETIAEAFVKIRNGEKVPDKAKMLVETHIERWKKK